MALGQAASTIKRYGAAATLARSTPGLHDAASGAPALATTTSTATSAVLDASSLKTLGFKFGDGLVQGGDLQATIPAKGLDFNPQPGDVLTVDSSPYRVAAVRPTYSGATPVMFELLLRVG